MPYPEWYITVNNNTPKCYIAPPVMPDEILLVHLIEILLVH